jgi:hypothetical protein
MGMYRIVVLLIACVVGAAFAASAGGDDSAAATTSAETPTLWDDCGLLGLDVAGAPACLDDAWASAAEAPTASAAADPTSSANVAQAGESSPPANCRLKVEAVFWTGTDWLRLATALAADPTPCAEYWISIPPLAANKTGLRVLQDDLIRALGPQFHPVAEMTLGDATGWGAWVTKNKKTWFEAGVEFRRRMASAGYDIPADETWLLNEFDRSTRRDAMSRDAVEFAHGLTVPYRRADMRELVRGLYYGDPGMPTSPGVAEIGINFTHQNIPDVAQYKREMEAWLQDSAFWTDIDRYVRFLAKEVYPDARLWGVPGSSRDDRRRHLDEYLFHVLDLVRSGPPSVSAARDFLEKAYLPLANAGYRARGGDQFDFVTGHGNTIISTEQMMNFVSEQVYSIRHYAGAHPQGAPAGRLGFSWQPCNRTSATTDACGLFNAEFQEALDQITARIASSIHYAYRQGGASPAGACAPPQSQANWCNGEVPGATFTDAWEIFDSWG